MTRPEANRQTEEGIALHIIAAAAVRKVVWGLVRDRPAQTDRGQQVRPRVLFTPDDFIKVRVIESGGERTPMNMLPWPSVGECQGEVSLGNRHYGIFNVRPEGAGMEEGDPMVVEGHRLLWAQARLVTAPQVFEIGARLATAALSQAPVS